MEKCRSQRKPSLAAAIRQARKAGVEVSGATIAPDGSVFLRFSQPGKSDNVEAPDNEWDVRLAGEARQ